MRKWVIRMLVLGMLLAAVGVGVVLATGNNGNRAVADSVIKTAAANLTEQQATQESQQNDQNDQQPAYQGSIQVPQPEPTDLSGLAKISADQAKNAALKDNAGATVTGVELGNENGSLVYSVQLANGMDVKVDAGNGAVLASEKQEAGDSQEQNGGKEAEKENGTEVENAQSNQT